VSTEKRTDRSKDCGATPSYDDLYVELAVVTAGIAPLFVLCYDRDGRYLQVAVSCAWTRHASTAIARISNGPELFGYVWSAATRMHVWVDHAELSLEVGQIGMVDRCVVVCASCEDNFGIFPSRLSCT
jgi:hypothetical protein